jgi:hypothetical protein
MKARRCRWFKCRCHVRSQWALCREHWLHLPRPLRRAICKATAEPYDRETHMDAIGAVMRYSRTIEEWDASVSVDGQQYIVGGRWPGCDVERP